LYEYSLCSNLRAYRDDAEEEDAELDDADDGAEEGFVDPGDGVADGRLKRSRRRRKQRRNHRQQTADWR
jgi:hypothetical protein